MNVYESTSQPRTDDLVLHFDRIEQQLKSFQGEKKRKGNMKETRTAERELKLDLIFQVYRGTLNYESVCNSFCFNSWN